MVYTEVKERNNKKYFYRVLSVREGKKVNKKRIYLGVNQSKKELEEKEKQADSILLKEKNKQLEKIKVKIIKVLKKHKVKRAGIFGSYSMGEQKKNSDIDILIEPPKNLGFAFMNIKFDLEDELGREVDLVTYKAVHPLLKKRILAEEVKIL